MRVQTGGGRVTDCVSGIIEEGGRGGGSSSWLGYNSGTPCMVTYS